MFLAVLLENEEGERRIASTHELNEARPLEVGRGHDRQDTPEGVDRLDINLERIREGKGQKLKRALMLVSRRHCQIEYMEGRWYLTDLGSRHGTLVKDDYCSDGQTMAWQPGIPALLGGLQGRVFLELYAYDPGLDTGEFDVIGRLTHNT